MAKRLGTTGAAKNSRKNAKTKRTSIGQSRNSRPKNKSAKRSWKPLVGQGNP